MITTASLGQTKLLIGKYKGKRFDAIPVDYLHWLADQDWIDNGLRLLLDRYLSLPDVAEELSSALRNRL